MPATSGRFALMMDAVSTSVKSVNFYHTTRRINPEDSQLDFFVATLIQASRQVGPIHKAEICFMAALSMKHTAYRPAEITRK
jgi:hypothetical protein